MPYSFKIHRRVEFSDTDMAGIVHFSNFFRYIESAEHAFFRYLGLSIAANDPNAPSWPRVHASCDFRRPLKFEDTVEVELLIREKRARSIAYTVIFRKVNADPVHEVARGSLTVACVKKDPVTGVMSSIPIPPEIAEKIEVAPAELFNGPGE